MAPKSISFLPERGFHLTIAVALVLIVFNDTFLSLWSLWLLVDYQHGLLVIPVALFLAWRRRRLIRHVSIEPELTGVLILCLVLAVWLLGRFSGVQLIEHAGALGLIPAFVLSLFGKQLFSKLAFPLLFVLTALPVGDSLVPILMTVTADVSAFMLQMSGIPVLKQGQYLSLPGGDFVVAEVCSGVRYLFSGVIISMLFAHLNFSSLRFSTILVAITALLMVLTNCVRAYLVMMIASATELQVLGGRDHVIFGWILFGIVITTLLWYSSRYADKQRANDSDDANESGTTTTSSIKLAAAGALMMALTVASLRSDFGVWVPYFAIVVALASSIVLFLTDFGSHTPEIDNRLQRSTYSTRSLFFAVVSISALSLTPVWAARVESSQIFSPLAISDSLFESCDLGGDWIDIEKPKFVDSDYEYSTRLECDFSSVHIFSASYSAVKQGKELVNSNNIEVPDSWGHVVDYRDQSMDVDSGLRVSYSRIIAETSNRRLIVNYWFDINGRVSGSRYQTVINQMFDKLFGDGGGGQFFAVVVEERENHAEETLNRVTTAIIRAAEANRT